MIRAVADTGPLHYLVLLDKIELLPALFESVSVPDAVREELLHRRAPPLVRTWAAAPPSWLALEPNPNELDLGPRSLGDGERAAIGLAVEGRFRLILIDDRAGTFAAREKGIAAVGTLGILDLGARRGLLDLGSAFERLKATTFRHSPSLMAALLARHQRASEPRD